MKRLFDQISHKLFHKKRKKKNLQEAKYEIPTRTAAPRFDVPSFRRRTRMRLENLKTATTTEAAQSNVANITHVNTTTRSPSPSQAPLQQDLPSTPLQSSYKEEVLSPVLLNEDSPLQERSNQTKHFRSTYSLGSSQFDHIHGVLQSYYAQQQSPQHVQPQQDRPLTPRPSTPPSGAVTIIQPSESPKEDLSRLEGMCDALYKHSQDLYFDMQDNPSLSETYEQYLHASAKLGNAYACMDLAELLLKQKQKDKALEYLEVAAQKGHQKAKLWYHKFN